MSPPLSPSRMIPRSSRQRRARAEADQRRPGPPPALERDWRAMRQVLLMLRAGALRMWGEIGRTT
jgi:hypothetical protein